MTCVQSKSADNNISVLNWITGTTEIYSTIEEASAATDVTVDEIASCINKKPHIYKLHVFHKPTVKASRACVANNTKREKDLPVNRPVLYQQEGSDKWYMRCLSDLARELNMSPCKVFDQVHKVSPKAVQGRYICELWEVEADSDKVISVGKCVHGGSSLSERDSVFQAVMGKEILPSPPAEVATFYMDGSTAPRNPGPSAFGIYGRDSLGNEYNCWGYIGDNETNNRAEMFGYIRLLESILHFKWQNVFAYFDSKYVLDNATRSLKRWKKNDWRKSDGDIIANKEQWVRISALQDAVSALGTKITYKWVKGHSGDVGNEAADVNANLGRAAGVGGNTDPVFTITTKEEQHEEAVSLYNAAIEAGEIEGTPVEASKKGKKTKIPSCNRLVAGKRLIFTTNSPMCTKDGKYIYLTNSFEGSVEKTGRFIGKPASDNMYGVVITEEPIPQIQCLIEFQNRITPADFVQPVVGLLNRITRSDIWEMLTTYGNSHLTHNRLNVTPIPKDPGSIAEPLTLYQRPARLAYDAIDSLMVMLDRLDRFRFNKRGKEESYTDITGYIFNTEGKKNKVHADISSSVKYVRVPVDYKGKKVDVVLTLGIDIPDRNSLSGISKQGKELEVQLVTYDETEAGFRYSVVIKVDGDIGLYSTSMANVKII